MYAMFLLRRLRNQELAKTQQAYEDLAKTQQAYDVETTSEWHRCDVNMSHLLQYDLVKTHVPVGEVGEEPVNIGIKLES